MALAALLSLLLDSPFAGASLRVNLVRSDLQQITIVGDRVKQDWIVGPPLWSISSIR